MPELVEHGDADLLAQLVHVGEVGLQRQPVDRDPVRQLAGLGPPSVSGMPVEEAVEVGLLGVLVLDDDRDVPQGGREVGGRLSSASRTTSSKRTQRTVSASTAL